MGEDRRKTPSLLPLGGGQPRAGPAPPEDHPQAERAQLPHRLRTPYCLQRQSVGLQVAERRFLCVYWLLDFVGTRRHARLTWRMSLTLVPGQASHSIRNGFAEGGERRSEGGPRRPRNRFTASGGCSFLAMEARSGRDGCGTPRSCRGEDALGARSE